MKKGLLMTVSALMVGTVILTGCGTEKGETTAQTAAGTAAETEAGQRLPGQRLQVQMIQRGLPEILPSFPEKTVQEPAGHLLNYSVLKKRLTVRRLI